MTDPFPPLEADPAPVPPPDPAPVPPAAAYGVDRILVQVIVAKMVDGHKVGEFPCAPVPLLYPFEGVPNLCEVAVEQVGASQEARSE